MLRKAFLAIALIASLSTVAFADTNLSVGTHEVVTGTTFTFPMFVTSDTGDTLQGVNIFLSMDPNGPIITKVDLLTDTVFSANNFGQIDYGAEEMLTPGRMPAYYTGTNPPGTVPVGRVAWITVDATGILPGDYSLSLDHPILGPATAFNQQGLRGTWTDGVIRVVDVPEPASIVLGLFGAASLGAIAIRRRRARNA